MLAMGLDTETTGLDVEKDRIVEIACILQNADTGTELVRYVRRINPGVSIPAKAFAIHGIADADVLGEPSFSTVAPLLAKLIEKTDVIIGHNVRDYDCPLLLHEFIRAGVKLSRFPAIIDTLEARWATPDGKVPNLGELAWSLDIPYDPYLAHGASYDTEVGLACFRRGLALGLFQLPVEETQE